MRSITSHYSVGTVRTKRTLSQSFAVAGFAAAYTLVVLPFTVNFFRDIASLPATGATLFTSVPLDQAHLFMLPLFLAALEFASIQLARNFWQMADLPDRILVFGLFLMCQSFTVTSVYYDVRNGNLAEERDKVAERNRTQIAAKETQLRELRTLLATKKSESFDKREDQIERITQRINAITTELAARREERTGMDQDIASLLVADTSAAAALAGEINERRSLRKFRETEQRSLIQERTRLQVDLTRLEAGLHGDFSRRVQEVGQLEASEKGLIGDVAGLQKENVPLPSSTVEYIMSNIFTTRSAFAALIALLFPITITGIGFVLQSPAAGRARPQSLNLEHELTAASAYPPEGQQAMARHVVAIIATYVTGLRASKELSGATTRFHLEDDLRQSILDELLAAKEEIRKSKLSQEAITYLSGEIDSLIDQQLIQEGVKTA
ncbi:MAG: hypothetical protein V1885_02550 [Candidatus Brennerbacteria bacterium]